MIFGEDSDENDNAKASGRLQIFVLWWLAGIYMKINWKRFALS